MSITSAKTGSTSLSLALENNFMEPIASTLVGSGGSGAIEFNDIPQTYKHLQIRCISRPNEAGSSGAQYLYLRINTDAGTNYSRHFLAGEGSTPVTQGAASQNEIRAGYQMRNGYAANIYAVAVIDILDYTNTNKYKTTRSLGGFDSNGAGYAALGSGLWMNTNSINSLTFLCEVGNFVQHTRFSLYGIKG